MKGRTFWVTLAPWETKRHLRFVISDPDENNLVMVVHMTKAAGKSRIDRTCILIPGEHPSIRVQSYIDYRRAGTMSIEEIHALESSQSLHFGEDLPQRLLLRIQNGAKISGNVQRRLEPFFRLFLALFRARFKSPSKLSKDFNKDSAFSCKFSMRLSSVASSISKSLDSFLSSPKLAEVLDINVHWILDEPAAEAGLVSYQTVGGRGTAEDSAGRLIAWCSPDEESLNRNFFPLASAR